MLACRCSLFLFLSLSLPSSSSSGTFEVLNPHLLLSFPSRSFFSRVSKVLKRQHRIPFLSLYHHLSIFSCFRAPSIPFSPSNLHPPFSKCSLGHGLPPPLFLRLLASLDILSLLPPSPQLKPLCPTDHDSLSQARTVKQVQIPVDYMLSPSA